MLGNEYFSASTLSLSEKFFCLQIFTLQTVLYLGSKFYQLGSFFNYLRALGPYTMVWRLGNRPMEYNSINQKSQFCNSNKIFRKYIEISIYISRKIIGVFADHNYNIIRMSKPTSIKTEPWSSFGSFTTNVVEDDFVHKNALTLKVKAVTKDGATVNIKQNTAVQDSKSTIKGELKYWFPLDDNAWLYTRVGSDHIKLHYDHGVSLLHNRKWNFYSSVHFSTSFTNYNLRTGVTHLNDVCTSDNRIKFTEQGELTFYHKTLITHNEFKLGLLGVYNATKNILAKKDIVASYIKDATEIHFKASQNWDSKPFTTESLTTFNKYSLTALWRKDPQLRFGVEVSSKGAKFDDAVALVEHNYSAKDFIKAKINSKYSLALLWKRKISGTATSSLSAQVPLAPPKGVDPFPKFGYQLQLNI